MTHLVDTCIGVLVALGVRWVWVHYSVDGIALLGVVFVVWWFCRLRRASDSPSRSSG